MKTLTMLLLTFSLTGLTVSLPASAATSTTSLVTMTHVASMTPRIAYLKSLPSTWWYYGPRRWHYYGPRWHYYRWYRW